MSSSISLRMKYHPAVKSVKFSIIQNNKEKEIAKNSILNKYQNQKGNFVLQDQGQVFFNDLIKVLDGEEELKIEVITTKLDYEDFTKMIEYYNKEEKMMMNVTLFAELPNMDKTFDNVMEYGEKSIKILKENKKIIINNDYGNKEVKECADNYAEALEKNIKNISEKMESLQDNNVNICFIGAYSSGKSALINSIIGYKILPEDPKSKTAKIYVIDSPKEKEKVRISFYIDGIYTALEWSDSKKTFEFTQAPVENKTRNEIQDVLNKFKKSETQQYEQIYQLLDKINDFENVPMEIKIKFPIPIDSSKVK